jgi:hypothetical protein
MRLYVDQCRTPNNHQRLSAAPETATQFSRFLEGGSGSGRLSDSMLAALAGLLRRAATASVTMMILTSEKMIMSLM